MENPETQKVREAFGTVLRQKRKERGYSQEELAHRAGIAMRYVSLLERNQRQPTISTLYLLCKALEISMGDFVLEMENK
jgi:transcriptional regulator with XRE-family HTH domain